MIKRAFHVDDSSISQRFVKDTLHLVDPGLQLLCFSSAKEAIASLEVLSGEEFPDVIFTDQAMPGMDGIDFLRWLKSHPRYHLIPVIMVSAESEEHRKKKALALGVFQYLEKPLQGDHVVVALEAVEQKILQSKVDREAEVHLTEEVLDRIAECSKFLDPLTEESIQGIKRHLHTIKGNAFSYQYPVLGEFIHELEQTLARGEAWVKPGSSELLNLLNHSFQYIREQALAIFETRAVKIEQSELFKLLREFGRSPEESHAEAPGHGTHAKPETKTTLSAPVLNDGISTRIPNDKLDHLQEQVKKIIQTKNRLANYVRGLRSEFPDEKFPEDLSRIHEELSEHSAHMMDFFINLRIVPLRRIQELLARIVPETSLKLAREVEYTLEFDEQDSIDHEVLNRIETALVHTVRNSIDHGFHGRSTGNRIDFKITRSKPDRFEILIRDNGHGIHPEKLKETVLKKKIFDSQAISALSPEQMLQLVFLDGLTTRMEATEFSGRGVGLGAVKSELARIGGSIEVKSEVGKGTEFRIEVPRYFKL
ncbi:MAG: response regulator [Bdellovibrionales bacterium]|nr:response regulator [Bdellovibrionales bacterium]